MRGALVTSDPIYALAAQNVPSPMTLADLTSRILGDSSPDELRETCAALYDLLSHAAGADALSGIEGIALPDGLALSPAAAAQCVLDTNRTVAFLRGTTAAVRRAQRGGREVEVVYAGTGPLAPLALPLMTLPEMQDVRFTLIDIHGQSVAAMRRLVRSLVPNASAQIVGADATLYAHPCPIDVVVTETMQQALRAEPFVAIVRNLRRQLAPGGVVVPERVTVSVGVVDPEWQQASWRGDAPTRTAVEKTTILQVSADDNQAVLGIDGRTRSVTVTLPPGWVALFTDIEVFGDIRLAGGDSGLTAPQFVWPLSSPTRGNVAVAFHYATGSRPGVEWEIVDANGATMAGCVPPSSS